MRVVPILKSADLSRSLQFYLSLGFEKVWGPPPEEMSSPGYACIRWHDLEIHLSSHSGDGAFGTAVYFFVDDIDRAFEELKAHGWAPPAGSGLRTHPITQTWGMRELYVDDPDGNCLRFGAHS
jgi:catechol 2,3-dioxygenase-like lactoylglutathione lyase family enzyme